MLDNKATEPPDPTQRRCYDCAHMKAAVSWWCTNEEAIRARGTSLPGIRECAFWSPAALASGKGKR